jgi:glyoxylase I family protein
MTKMFSLEHIGLSAREPLKLIEWYQRVLSAQLVWEISQNPPAALLNLGGMMIEIYSAESSSELTGNNRLAGWRHVALRVESLDRARELLADRGVEFAEQAKPAGGGGRVIFFNDPEGNLLHLVERLSVGFQ